jgi:hypothetical protein
MDGNINHQKSVALGWDISASAKAESAETISAVDVVVNGISEYSETFSQPTNSGRERSLRKASIPATIRAS